MVSIAPFVRRSVGRPFPSSSSFPSFPKMYETSLGETSAAAAAKATAVVGDAAAAGPSVGIPDGAKAAGSVHPSSTERAADALAAAGRCEVHPRSRVSSSSQSTS